jgi:hypothetical protein
MRSRTQSSVNGDLLLDSLAFLVCFAAAYRLRLCKSAYARGPNVKR